MSDFSPAPEGEVWRESATPSGLEPELGGIWRDTPERSGLEPELGAQLRQNAPYVDETTCIGCKHCAHVAPNTFYIESEHGRSRVFNHNGNSEELIQEAIDTCPVDCIHWVDFTEVKRLEAERKYQIIQNLGFPQKSKLPIKKRKKLTS
jgi:ferredoxin